MDLLFYAAELIGTAAFALSGALLAIQKRLDLFGVLFLAVVTALGGGTIRDLLLGRTPPRMFYGPEYVLLAAGVALAIFVLARISHGRITRMNHWMELCFEACDAVGLGIFSVMGTQAVRTVGYGDQIFLSVVMGMTTGVGGGVLRDMMCGDIPFVLHKHIYAVAAIAGSLSFYLLRAAGTEAGLSTLAGVALTIILRLLARHFRWNLPKAEG